MKYIGDRISFLTFHDSNAILSIILMNLTYILMERNSPMLNHFISTIPLFDAGIRRLLAAQCMDDASVNYGATVDFRKDFPEGELGELVITTLVKEGSPLIRYRTHDITRLIPGPCPCGSPYPRHDRIVGRTDDMVKVKGVNIFPGQIDSLLSSLPGASSEYQVHIDHFNGKDRLRLRFEKEPEVDAKTLEDTVVRSFKNRIGITIAAEAVEIGVLPRSEKKSKRIFDERYA